MKATNCRQSEERPASVYLFKPKQFSQFKSQAGRDSRTNLNMQVVKDRSLEQPKRSSGGNASVLTELRMRSKRFFGSAWRRIFATEVGFEAFPKLCVSESGISAPTAPRRLGRVKRTASDSAYHSEARQ